MRATVVALLLEKEPIVTVFPSFPPVLDFALGFGGHAYGSGGYTFGIQWPYCPALGTTLL